MKLPPSKSLQALLSILIIQYSTRDISSISEFLPLFNKLHNRPSSESLTFSISSHSTYYILFYLTKVFFIIISLIVYKFTGYRTTFIIFRVIALLFYILSTLASSYEVCLVTQILAAAISNSVLTIIPLYCCWRYCGVEFKMIIASIIFSSYAILPFISSCVDEIISE